MKQQYNAITPTVVIPIPEEKQQYLKVTYLVDDSLQCQIVSNPDNILAIKIDGGEEIPWVTPDSMIQIFKTPGEHTVEFILKTNTMMGGMLNGDSSPITNIEFPEVEFNIAAGSISMVDIKSLVIPETVENFTSISTPLLNLETLEVNCKYWNGDGGFNGSYNFPKLKTIKIGKNCQCNCSGSSLQSLQLDYVYIDGTLNSSGGLFGGTNIKTLVLGDNYKNLQPNSSIFNGCNIDLVKILDVKDIFDIYLFGKGAYPRKFEFHCKKLTSTSGSGSIGSYLEEVVIGNEVEEIINTNNNWFLSGCSQLKKITIGNSLKELGYFLQSCSYLSELNIPNNIKKLKYYAFYTVGMDRVLQIKFNGPIIIEPYAFTSTPLVTLDIPIGSKLQHHAFYNIAPLSVIFHDGGECLQDPFGEVFYNSSGYTYKVEFDGGSSVSINKTSDGYTYGPNEISFSPSINKISDQAFARWTNLKSIYIPETIDYVGKESFFDSTIQSATIKAREIGERAFMSTGSCYIFDIYSRIIGKEAFYGSNNSARFYFSKNLIEIGESAFQGHYFPQNFLNIFNCKIIGKNAFKNINNSSFRINLEKVEEIGEGAFYSNAGNCIHNLTNIKTIGKEAFYANTRINYLYFGEHLISLGDSAFENCVAIRNDLIIPNSTKTIGVNCFKNCQQISSITIGKNVSYIGEFAFNCHSNYLNKIQVHKDNKTYDSRENCNSLIETKTNTLIQGSSSSFIPASIKAISEEAFSGLGNSTLYIKCCPITPPNLLGTNHSSIFMARSVPMFVLVPPESLELYEEAWSDVNQSYLKIGGIKYIYAILNIQKEGKNTIATSLDNLSSINIDGENVPLQYTYNFVTTGNHVIKYELKQTAVGNLLSEVPQLIEITFPKYFTDISSFSGSSVCTKKLESIIVDDNNVEYDSRNNCNALIKTSNNVLILGCKNTIIPENITSIASYAFYNCQQLTTITIPDSVTSIEGRAFDTCINLTTVVMSNNLTSLSINNPFSNCSSLPVENGIKYADTYLVEAVSDSPYIIKQGTKYIGSLAFENKSIQSGFSIPESVKFIGYNAFKGSDLEDIIIPSSVISLSLSIFRQCTSLETAVVNAEITQLASYMFRDCTNLINVTLPNTLESIGDYAFQNCGKLPSITIPNKVTTIGSYVFSGCTLLKEITIDSNPLTSKTSYTSTSNNFYKLFGSQVNKYIFTDNIQTIGKYTCYSCSNLKAVEIGTNVTSIGNNAFSSCYLLESITIKATTPPTLGANVFTGNKTGRKIYVPAGSVDTYKAASGWSTYASYIEAIPTE